ncbi:MAG: nuclear transport factor 2 family protein [Gammaproteobacteria bacterium]|nr:nuclear transport factor 2 family protein [Gammaproteobacteria bacterium]
MTGRTTILIAAACAALATGCAKPAPEAPMVDLAAEAQAVRDRSAAWLQMAQARDAASIASGIYTSDAVSLFDGKILKGPGAMQADMEAGAAAMPNSTITWSTSDVKVAASGDLAYELGTFTFDPDGADSKPATNGEFVTVWSKVDGTWRAAVDAGAMMKAPDATTQ